MKVLVIGASGGSGLAVARELEVRGHQVTGMARRPDPLAVELPAIDLVEGDATVAADVDRAVAGQDAVVITLGISENPLRVRVRGPRRTALDVRSRGTRLAVEAMRRHGVDRLLVQSTYGIGASSGHLTVVERAFFRLVLKPQIRDTVEQESVTRGSGLRWTLIQPVNLTDEPSSLRPAVHVGAGRESGAVSRQQVGVAIADALSAPATIGRSLAVSSASGVAAERRAHQHSRG